MIRYTTLLSLILILIFTAAASTAFAAQGVPVVMSFELSGLDGASKAIVTEATQAVKQYLRNTGRAEVVSFDIESPLIKRAVAEERLKPEDLVNVTLIQDQMKVARVLEASHVLAGQVSYKHGTIGIKVILADTDSKNAWQKEGVASASGPDLKATQQNISNAIQTAASTAISAVASEALKDVIPMIDRQSGPVLLPGDAYTPLDAQAYAKEGDKLFAENNMAGAIAAYKKAVNADPSNIQYRIQLSKSYSKRGLNDLAADELKRAQQLNPANEEVRLALAKLYEDSGAPEKAAEVYVKQTQADPGRVDTWLNAGDLFWRQQKLDEAEQQYLSAIKVDPYDARPRERLLLLFAARGMFGESKAQLEQVQKLYANAGDPALAERYDKLKPIMDLQLQTLSNKIKDNNDRFRAKTMTREDLYSIVKGVSLRLESMSKFLEALTVPDDKKPELQKRVLASNLICQAGYSIISYLETNNTQSRDDADMFLAEAARQLKDKK